MRTRIASANNVPERLVVASPSCSRCHISFGSINTGQSAKHHFVCRLLPPDLQAALQRPKLTVRISSRVLRLQPFQQLPAGSPGLGLKPVPQPLGCRRKGVGPPSRSFGRRLGLRGRPTLRRAADASHVCGENWSPQRTRPEYAPFPSGHSGHIAPQLLQPIHSWSPCSPASSLLPRLSTVGEHFR